MPKRKKTASNKVHINHEEKLETNSDYILLGISEPKTILEMDIYNFNKENVAPTSVKKQKIKKKIHWGNTEERIITFSEVYYEKNIAKLEKSAYKGEIDDFLNITENLTSDQIKALLEEKGLFSVLVRQIYEKKKKHEFIYEFSTKFDNLFKILFIEGENSLALLHRFIDFYDLAFQEEGEEDILIWSMKLYFISGIEESLKLKQKEYEITKTLFNNPIEMETKLETLAEKGDIVSFKSIVEEVDKDSLKLLFQNNLLTKFIYNFYLSFVYLNKNYESISQQKDFIALSKLFADKGEFEKYMICLRELKTMLAKQFNNVEAFNILICDAEEAINGLKKAI